MEDLFDGWLAMPSMEGFLAGGASAGHTKRLKSTPHTEPQDQFSPESARLLTLDEDTHGQSLTISSVNTPAQHSGLRQRRGHTKSRLGCIACKKRKIKCQETWPSCANCIKRGTICRYPSVFKSSQHDRIVSEVLGPRQFVQLSDTPNIYSSNDMHLFHHYLISAYPCIPHENDAVWIKEIPTYSHQYSYLMHAMLALAGSHLALQVDDPNINLAITYRQKAIVGLEEAFARWPTCAGEAHVMLATSYLLSFQSSYMADGFLDHIISLRGCALISQLISSHGLKGPFAILADMYGPVMDTAFSNFPCLDQELVCEALLSLKGFAHLVAGANAHPIEKSLMAQFVGTIRPLLRDDTASELDTAVTPDLTEATTLSQSSIPCAPSYRSLPIVHPLFPTELLAFDDIDWDTITNPPSPTPDPPRSFNASMSTLFILAAWPHDALLHVFSPKNQLGNIVMAHFCALRFIASPLSALKTAMRNPVRAVVEWLTTIIAAVEADEDREWATYLAWPKMILKCMQACLEKKKGFTFGDIRDMLINDPGALREGRARRA